MQKDMIRLVFKYWMVIVLTVLLATLLTQGAVFAQDSQDTGIPDMPHPRLGMCSARLDNTIYFIGGAQGLQGKNLENATGTTTVQAFDFETRTWKTNIASLETPRVFACAVSLDDSIYVMGGVDSNGDVLNSVEVYSPSENEWHYTSSMKFERKGAAATTWDGRILVFGGGDSSNVLHREVEAYNPESGSWKVLPDSTLFGRAFHHVAKVGGAIYIYGGVGARIGPIGIIEKYVPGIGVVGLRLTWNSPRAFFGTVTRNDSVYVISGYGSPSNGTGYYNDVVVFNFANADSAIEDTTNLSLSTPRRSFVAALGNDGRIYLFGGISWSYKSGLVPLPNVSVIGTPTAYVSAVDRSRAGIPSGFTLNQNFPNPFNPTTVISFGVPVPGSRVSIDIYNTLGQKVMTLVDGYYSAGTHAVTFDGGNLPSGAYIYRLETQKGNLFRKMVLIK